MKRASEGDEETMKWPNHPPSFPTLAKKLFLRFEELSKEVLSVLALGLKVDKQKLLELTEGELVKGELSNSFMHFFRYQTDFECSPFIQCVPHTDSGLVTLIPCASSDGLEVLNWKSFEFECVEKNADSRQVVVLVGETLARLTCTYYQGAVHQVIRRHGDELRYSVPFQLRGKLDAVIDTIGLDSPVVKIQNYAKEKVTIRDFIV